MPRNREFQADRLEQQEAPRGSSKESRVPYRLLTGISRDIGPLRSRWPILDMIPGRPSVCSSSESTRPNTAQVMRAAAGLRPVVGLAAILIKKPSKQDTICWPMPPYFDAFIRLPYDTSHESPLPFA